MPPSRWGSHNPLHINLPGNANNIFALWVLPLWLVSPGFIIKVWTDRPMCTDSTKYLILHLLPHVQMVHSYHTGEWRCRDLRQNWCWASARWKAFPWCKKKLISVFVYPLHSPGVRLDLGGDVIGHLRWGWLEPIQDVESLASPRCFWRGSPRTSLIHSEFPGSW